MKPIHIILLFFAILNSFKIANAQDTIKVLFIGNSFTSQNNLPSLFAQLAQGAGKNVVVASHMPGGVSVGDISQGTSAHMNNPMVYSLIKSNNWDYLVLQDNQGRFCLGYGQFSSSSLVIQGHLKILDSLLYYNPCAHIIWFAGFGTKNGFSPYASSGIAMIDSIYHNYQFLNDSAEQIIAPIGPAFKRIILGTPSLNLWDSDDTHPSLFGSYLTANVLYTTIFKSSPIKSSYNPGINSDVDSLLKNTGYKTTMDSINFTGLSEITPTIYQSGNTLSVNGSQNCNWYYNGVPYISNNCTINITQPGNYYAVVSDINNCQLLTLDQSFIMTKINEYDWENSNIHIYPNPTNDIIRLQIDNINIPFFEYRIYDYMGNLLKFENFNIDSKVIDVSDLKNGIYILVLKSDQFSKSLKFVIEK